MWPVFGQRSALSERALRDVLVPSGFWPLASELGLASAGFGFGFGFGLAGFSQDLA